MKVKVDGDTGSSPAPATANITVAVAVKSAEGRGSQRAVKWAVEKLLPKANRFVFIHVMPIIATIPTPCKFSCIVLLFENYMLVL